MSSRVHARTRVLLRAARHRVADRQRRAPPADPRRILVVPTALLGDTLFTTPLLAKLRERHPGAEVTMTVRPAIVPLYAARPYGVRALAYELRSAGTLDAIFAQEDFDLALVPGDNRHSWLAAAVDARWIVAFAGDRPAPKSWMVDELRPYRATPAAWGDMVADLVDGPPPRPYRPADWPAPPCAPFAQPGGGYAVLHVGAGSPLRLWQPEKWRALAEALEQRRLQVVWSAGAGEEGLVEEIDGGRRRSYAGKLDLAQMWHLLAGAALLITLDTGIAHLAKVVGVPTVTLYGPGSAQLFGRGEFWRDAPFREVTVPDFPCRDQQILFKRRVEWVRRCQRSISECPAPRCMHAISVEDVLRAIP